LDAAGSGTVYDHLNAVEHTHRPERGVLHRGL